MSYILTNTNYLAPKNSLLTPHQTFWHHLWLHSAKSTPLCTTPYFHKDTLTPPSSSRSPLLEGGGPSTYAATINLYIMHVLYFEIYTTLLEVIQLMSIAGYEAYVCVCFFVYKTLCAAFIWLPCDACTAVACMCVILREKNYLIQKI